MYEITITAGGIASLSDALAALRGIVGVSVDGVREKRQVPNADLFGIPGVVATGALTVSPPLMPHPAPTTEPQHTRFDIRGTRRVLSPDERKASIAHRMKQRHVVEMREIIGDRVIFSRKWLIDEVLARGYKLGTATTGINLLRRAGYLRVHENGVDLVRIRKDGE